MRQWRTFSADRAEGENAVRPADQAESERKRLSGQAPAQRGNRKKYPPVLPGGIFFLLFHFPLALRDVLCYNMIHNIIL